MSAAHAHVCVCEREREMGLPSPGCPSPRAFSFAIRTHPARVWVPQPPPTLKRGVSTTAPALPNSKAVSSWGSTLCRQKSSGKESRLLLSSWKNFCFSAGSLIWGSKDRTQVGDQPSHATPQLWARTGGPPSPEREPKLMGSGAQQGWVQIPTPPVSSHVTWDKSSICETGQ